MNLPRGDVVIVSGTANVDVRPDVVSIDVGVETTGTEVRAIVRQNSEKVAKIVAALKERGVKPEELRTSEIGLAPVEKDEKRIGYRITTSVGVTRKGVADIGDLISATIEAGANEIRGPEFSASDEKEVAGRCMELAFADARSKAEKLATLSARKLGKVLAVTDGSSSPFEFRYRTPGAEGGVLGGLLVEPGVHHVPCGVTVAFRLE